MRENYTFNDDFYETNKNHPRIFFFPRTRKKALYHSIHHSKSYCLIIYTWVQLRTLKLDKVSSIFHALLSIFYIYHIFIHLTAYPKMSDQSLLSLQIIKTKFYTLKPVSIIRLYTIISATVFYLRSENGNRKRETVMVKIFRRDISEILIQGWL